MSADEAPLYGGMETGGTKIVCAVGSGPDDLHDEIRFPTGTPDESLRRALSLSVRSAGTAAGLVNACQALASLVDGAGCPVNDTVAGRG